jgi:polyhydroxyalkanoate synthesis regulator phasin
MLDTIRRYVEAGREALTPKKAEELARALVQQGQAKADQAGQIARDLVEWSRKSSERLQKSIRHEVQKQMSKTGVATKEEVEALKRRIRELESQAKLQAKTQGKPKPKAPAKAPTVRRATTPRSGGTGIAKAPATSATAGSRKSQTSGATRIPKGGTARRTPPAGTRGG